MREIELPYSLTEEYNAFDNVSYAKDCIICGEELNVRKNIDDFYACLQHSEEDWEDYFYEQELRENND